jgi:tRNA-binding EMAP/Myf-like protein
MSDHYFLLKDANFKGEFSGVMVCAEKDLDNEMIDWEPTKRAVKKWSDDMARTTGGKSYGNLREMHSTNVVGKLTEPPEVDEKNRCIRVKGVVIDPVAKDKLQEGCFSGLSIGGRYSNKHQLRDGTMAYTPVLSELSLADKPCSPSAVLTLTRSDGSVLQKRFRSAMPDWKRSLLVKLALAQVANHLSKTPVCRKGRINPNVAAANLAFPGAASQGRE